MDAKSSICEAISREITIPPFSLESFQSRDGSRYVIDLFRENGDRVLRVEITPIHVEVKVGVPVGFDRGKLFNLDEAGVNQAVDLIRANIQK